MKSKQLVKLNQRVLSLALASALAFGGTVSAVNSYAATGTGTATATVFTPISVAQGASPGGDLRFGKFAASATAGSVTITAAGARTGSNVVLSSNNAGGAAAFTVTGEGAATYAITLPGAAVNIVHSVDTLKTMSVGSWTGSKATGTISGTGGTTGTDTFTVGATVTVGASQAAGSYSGTFTMTVEYN